MIDSYFWRTSPLRMLELLKVLSGSELPDEYKRVLGFEFASDCYYAIDDFKLTSDDTVRISFSVDKACNVFGCYTSTDAATNYSLYMTTSASGKYLRYGSGTYASYIASSNMGKKYNAVITPTGSQGMPTNDTWSKGNFTCVSDLCIGTTSPGATSAKLDGCIYGDFVVDGKLKLIPCERISDGVLGYYDKYSKTFFAPKTGTPTSLGYA